MAVAPRETTFQGTGAKYEQTHARRRFCGGRGFQRAEGRPGRFFRLRRRQRFHLTCGQLANTYQEDANALATWYSGWHNGLAHKHYADFKKGRIVEHQVIEYCKAHQDQKIIHAISVILKEDRAEGLMQER
jgi:hypothetical protein